ncbi:M4 family metallopeptidase [Actinoallomurus iriomotensis]|uniref:Neutral metalloproteinase n=1 Tax=Actinoallomurus iriomotensis TaxID=478107 RepID=A0A9W6S7K9_9ACTN|nr:M4 family metallopeptidase [Actinoallomurus iriomotensis]GLY90011.1 metalloprotease [Actinoallomurus iriomotensis]
MRCAIVPPHVLRHVAEQHSDEQVRELVQRTLSLDHTQRGTRAAAQLIAEAPKATAPAAANRTIHDAGHKETLPGPTVRSEGGAATGDQAADQIYDWLGVTYDFYNAAYGRNSIDGAGLPLVASVHYSVDYDNAFWDGSQMVYGDGDQQIFATFTAPLDVTGHELTHGVTQYSGGLEYQGQSGALNESLSDVFGSLVKQYHLGQTADQADWLIGQGMFAAGVHGTALRSMKAPGTAYDDPNLGKDPQPADMQHYVDTDSDNGGVHINSGIPNRAFYLTATAIGGHAWEKAGRIWYDTITGKKVPTTADFAKFASMTYATAGKLFGVKSTESDAVREAWSTVGVKVT